MDREKQQNGKRRPERPGRFLAGQAARLAEAVVFWCLAGLLASTAYSGYQRISEAAVRGGISSTSPGEAVGGNAVDIASEETAERNAVDIASEEAAEGSFPGESFQEAGNQELLPGGGGDVPLTEAEEPERRQVALTFDDGPHPVFTAELLDGLKERGIPATFFVVGKNIPGNEELVARMEREGHLIGNHTYDHVKICDMAVGDACAQVEKTSTLVRELTGHDTEFVRPPFGAWKKGMECSFAMIPVLWDVDPLDWTTTNADLVVSRVLKEVEPGDIILLHDYYASSVEAALRIADALTEQGYEFVTADRLILE